MKAISWLPPTHCVVFLMKGAGRQCCRSSHVVSCGQGELCSLSFSFGGCLTPGTALDSEPAWGLSHSVVGQSPICYDRQPFSCSQPRRVTWKGPGTLGDVAAQQLNDGVVPSSSYKCQGCSGEPSSGGSASATEARTCGERLCSGQVTRTLGCRRPTSAL